MTPEDVVTSHVKSEKGIDELSAPGDLVYKWNVVSAILDALTVDAEH